MEFWRPLRSSFRPNLPPHAPFFFYISSRPSVETCSPPGGWREPADEAVVRLCRTAQKQSWNKRCYFILLRTGIHLAWISMLIIEILLNVTEYYSLRRLYRITKTRKSVFCSQTWKKQKNERHISLLSIKQSANLCTILTTFFISERLSFKAELK